MSLLIQKWAIALTGYRQVFDPSGGAPATNRLLLETGDALLMENGDFFELE